MALARPWLPEDLPLNERADIELKARFGAQHMDTDVRATAASFGKLSARAQIPLEPNGKLHGDVRFSTDDLSWVNLLAPELLHIQGKAQADIQLAGTLDQPRPQGVVTVQDLSFTVPATGVRFVNGALHAQIDGDRKVVATAQLSGAESGQWRMAGQGHLDSLTAWQVDMQLQGESMAVMRSPELDMDLRPLLRVQANAQEALITGQLHLPLVTVRVHTLPAGSVKESADLVLAGGGPPPKKAYVVKTDVELILGEQVHLSGMGLSSRVAGRLRLRSDGSTPLAAFGEVTLQQGRFSAYGQELTIDPGRLSFNGPINNPGLKVKASRTVGDYQVGLNMTGTLTAPRTEVYATPHLAQSDALSLLLTGRLLSAGSSGADATMLVNALASLGVNQSEGILQEIGNRVGFDELGLTTKEGLAAAEITVGKRINSRLMMRYMVGAFDGVGRFVTEYRINRFWDVEIVSSPVEQRGDLIFRIER